MARTGSFGRYRGNYGSLSALVLSLLRQQRAEEDRAIEDAYTNGGLYQGKPVTDERLLEHYRQRRDATDRSDPTWDEWDNRVTQQKFSIGEQKIGLRYKQGKASASDVANYYRAQLKHLDKDSAFYREVAGRAADWAQSAQGAARARAGARTAAALSDKQAAIARDQQAFVDLNGLVTVAAQRAGIITGNQQVTDAQAEAIHTLFATGIFDAQGDRITLDEWQSAARDYYKTFDRQIKINKQLNRGYQTWKDARDDFKSKYLIGMDTLDDREQYEVARQSYEGAIEDAHGDPDAILAANQRFAADVLRIRDNAAKPKDGKTNDPLFIGALTNTYNALTTGKDTGPTATDLYPPLGFSGNDAETLAGQASDAKFDSQALASGTAFMAQTEPGGVFQPVAYPPASDAMPNHGLGDDLQPTVIEDGSGKRKVVYLKGQAVTASNLVDAATGQVVDPTSLSQQDIANGVRTGAFVLSEGSSPIGYVYTRPNGKNVYGVYDSNGDLTYSEKNPFTGSIQPSQGGLTVLSSTAVPTPDGKGTMPTLTGALSPNAGSGSPLLDIDDMSTRDLDALAPKLNLTTDKYDDYKKRILASQNAKLAQNLMRHGEDRQSGLPVTSTKPIFQDERPGVSPLGSGLSDAIAGAVGAVKAAILPPGAPTAAPPQPGSYHTPVGTPPVPKPPIIPKPPKAPKPPNEGGKGGAHKDHHPVAPPLPPQPSPGGKGGAHHGVHPNPPPPPPPPAPHIPGVL